MSTSNPRPDDSFERRFALEQAVLVTARRHGDVGNDEHTQGFTIATAERFLTFLKGESK